MNGVNAPDRESVDTNATPVASIVSGETLATSVVEMGMSLALRSPILEH